MDNILKECKVVLEGTKANLGSPDKKVFVGQREIGVA